MRYLKWLHKNTQDMNGKVVIVTGANSGIGFETTKYLCYLGAHVIMACRSLNKAKIAKDKILINLPDAIIDIVKYDQSSFESIRGFVKTIKESYSHVDVLVNNAGIYHPAFGSVSKDGLPLTIHTNYIGCYYLTKLMLPYLEQFEGSKVIFETSITAKHNNVNDYRFLTSCVYHGNKDYGMSKSCVAKMFIYFQNKTSVKVLMSHPGVASTNIFSSASTNFSVFFKRLAHAVLPVFVHSTAKASLGLVKLCADDTISTNTFLGPRGPFELAGYPKKRKVATFLYKNVDELISITDKIVLSAEHIKED